MSSSSSFQNALADADDVAKNCTISQEEAKNMALLFFMDHLMTKNGCRTIHDLSCQFGARGFSPEMREAVGSTQEGLTEFLAQYPSLFVLDGDTVTMTGYGDLALGGAKASPLLQNVSRDRNYEQEAVQFFEEKLKRFGPELQIKSLLGHRSQSAPEIRLVSGRHVKDFTDFLINHPDNFVVENDRVRLSNMPEPLDRCSSPETDEDSPGNEPLLDEFGQILTGAAKAKQKALEFLKSVVENGYNPQSSLVSKMDQQNASCPAPPTPVPIDILYKKFCDRFAHKIRQQVATNPKELLQFLKLNRHIFFIRSNKVSIVRNKNNNTNASSSTSENGDTEQQGQSPQNPNGFESAVDGLGSWVQGAYRPVVVKSLLSAQNALVDVAGYCQQSQDTAFTQGCYAKPAVAIDFKCVTLGDRQFLSLVVVALGDGSKIYIFDVAHSSSVLMESGLRELMEDDDVIKVTHDYRKIAFLLYDQYKIVLHNVFDTQIANSVLQHQRIGKPLHEIKPVTFNALQRLYHPQSLMYSDQAITSSTQKEDSIWSKRPLTEHLIALCTEEVRFLMPFIYRSMNNIFKPEMRSLFERLCNEISDGKVAFSPSTQDLDRKVINEITQNGTGFVHQKRRNICSRPQNFQDTFNDQFDSHKPNNGFVGKVATSANFTPATSKPCCSLFCHSNDFGAKSRLKEVACQTVATGDRCVAPVNINCN